MRQFSAVQSLIPDLLPRLTAMPYSQSHAAVMVRCGLGAHALLVVLLALGQSTDRLDAAETLRPLPDAKTSELKTPQMHELLKVEYAMAEKELSARQTLYDRLMELAAKSLPNDPQLAGIMAIEAGSVIAADGDLRRASAAVDWLAKHFAVKDAAIRKLQLARLLPMDTMSIDDAAAAVDDILVVTADLERTANDAAALEAAGLAETAARRSRDRDLIKRVQARRVKIEQRQRGPDAAVTEANPLRQQLKKAAFLDWKFDTWRNDVRDGFEITPLKDAVRVRSRFPDSRDPKLILFPHEDITAKKLVASFQVEEGTCKVSLRPKDFSARGADLDFTFAPGQRYTIELWLEGSTAGCLINGQPAKVAARPECFGYFAFLIDPQAAIVFHDLQFVSKQGQTAVGAGKPLALRQRNRPGPTPELLEGAGIRFIWRSERFDYVKDNENRWRSKSRRDVNVYHFIETARTPEYVELYDKVPNWFTRLPMTGRQPARSRQNCKACEWSDSPEVGEWVRPGENDRS